jgi:hypothetical protein
MRDVLRSAFWLLPALCVAASVGAAIGLVALDHSVGLSSTMFLSDHPARPGSPLGRPAPGLRCQVAISTALTSPGGT